MLGCTWLLTSPRRRLTLCSLGFRWGFRSTACLLMWPPLGLEAGMRHSGVSPLCPCRIVSPHSCEASGSSPCCAMPPWVTAPLLVFLPIASFTQ